MSELKTLKDIEITMGYKRSNMYSEELKTEAMISKEELKAEVIKWIKEDMRLVKNIESHKMLERWKERFNITIREIEDEN